MDTSNTANSSAYAATEEQINQLNRFQQFLKYDPDNLSLTLDAVKLAIEIQAWAITQGLIEEAITKFPNNAQLNAHAGYIFMVLGEHHKAREHFMVAINLGDSSPVLMFNLAQTQFFLGDMDAAKKALLQDSRIKSELPQEYLLLNARLSHFLGEFDEAIACLRTLEREYELSAESAGLLSLMLFESNADFSEALLLADTALTKNPKAIEALIARTSLYLELGKYDQAWMDITLATQNYPQNGRAWSSLAQVEFNNLAFDKALIAAQQAVVYMPNHIGTWHLLGWSHLMLNQMEPALDAFLKSYALDRAFAETHGGIAAVYAHMDEIKLANNHIKLAHKINPNGLASIYAEMVLLNRANKSDEANVLFENAKQTINSNLGTTPKQLIEKRLIELSATTKSNKIH